MKCKRIEREIMSSSILMGDEVAISEETLSGSIVIKGGGTVKAI